MSVVITIGGTSYRMTRDGMEALVNGVWESPDTDYDPTETETAVFWALEKLSTFDTLASLKTMTVAEAELQVALDQVARLVEVMRTSDPEYCESHGCEPCHDEDWDEAQAEDYLEERRAQTPTART
jgi:hypothetical protein